MNSPIDWDTYFMSVAILTSKRSKDNNTQVGAVIVDKFRRIIGTGCFMNVALLVSMITYKIKLHNYVYHRSNRSGYSIFTCR